MIRVDRLARNGNNPLLQKSLEPLEIVECDCHGEPKPFCFFWRKEGCPHHRRHGWCDHALTQPPCEHVWTADNGFYSLHWAVPFFNDDEDDLPGLTIEWVKRLQVSSPKEYADRPSPSPRLALTRAARIDLMRLRYAAGQAIFDPQPVPTPEALSINAQRHPNGAVYETGILLKQREVS